MNQYLALLRGINVGGRNIIRMSDLKEGFESFGFQNVITYIQSGNVIFESAENDKSFLAEQIETSLALRFKYESKIVLLNRPEMDSIIREAPPAFGAYPEEFRYDVIFFREGISPGEIANKIMIKEGVDQAASGNYTLYFSRLISRVTKSRLKDIMSLPEYKNMSIRNWKTSTEIHKLMQTGRK